MMKRAYLFALALASCHDLSWKKLEAVTHSRDEATTCYELAQIITHCLSHELPRVRMSYEFDTTFLQYKSWKLSDIGRNVVVNE